ncbi:hypothetical protein EST38_g182 [Candolleomyces aberdarensis]|uniref:Uncharacterized protein n=1 Tax=Candolleomyces aberdarensis TaxID=2316362 RepID=A0A4Q2E0Q0_9AGAR|nr:hypothetical protein EST38_g182 [Candolleomyces aberdarensis]
MSSTSTPIEAYVPALPPGKTAVTVVADFLRYLFKCTETYIQEKEPNGESLWSSLQNQIDFILTHPNGWEGAQQSMMREAAVMSGLIPDTDEGHSQLSFVTEGEASLHFAVRNGFPKSDMKPGEGVLILDAGGGTIDTTTYAKRADGWYEEIAAPQCHFNGSIFVTLAAQQYLNDLLADSRFLDDLDHIVDCFDKTTKPRFSNPEEMQFVKFGKTKDNDETCNIRYGQLKLAGKEVASFFEPAVRCVLDAIAEQQKQCKLPYIHVVLVGGFSASDYLFQQLTKHLEPKGCQVLRPDSYVSKACSDGAISFYLDHFVQSRVSKMTYGCFANVLYRQDDPEHYARESSAFITLAGEIRLPGAFNIILPKGVQVSEATEFRSSYCQLFKDKAEFATFTSQVWSYRGHLAEPRWRDFDSASYSLLCMIKVDVTNILKNTKATRQSSTQGKFYRLEYDLVLIFGCTEFKAQIAWKEKGMEKRSPAKILYNYHAPATPDTSSG